MNVRLDIQYLVVPQHKIVPVQDFGFHIPLGLITVHAPQVIKNAILHQFWLNLN